MTAIAILSVARPPFRAMAGPPRRYLDVCAVVKWIALEVEITSILNYRKVVRPALTVESIRLIPVPKIGAIVLVVSSADTIVVACALTDIVLELVVASTAKHSILSPRAMSLIGRPFPFRPVVACLKEDVIAPLVTVHEVASIVHDEVLRDAKRVVAPFTVVGLVISLVHMYGALALKIGGTASSRQMAGLDRNRPYKQPAGKAKPKVARRNFRRVNGGLTTIWNIFPPQP